MDSYTRHDHPINQIVQICHRTKEINLLFAVNPQSNGRTLCVYTMVRLLENDGIFSE